MYVRLRLWVRPSFTAPWASPHYLSNGRSSQPFTLSGTREENEFRVVMVEGIHR